MIPFHPSLTVSLGEGESAASFCSRMAKRFKRTAREFCGDLGISFQHIVDGNPTAINSLALRCRVDPALLQEQTLLKLSEIHFTIRSQSLVKDALRRRDMRFCPHCLIDDINTGSGSLDIRPYARTEWLIDPIRTCAKHDAALVEANQYVNVKHAHDFYAYLNPNLEWLGELSKTSLSRRASDFELYLIDRLANGARAAIWFDTLPFYAAAKACEIIGGVASNGPRFRSQKSTDLDRREHESLGFEIARSGEPGIRSFLTELQRTFRPGTGPWGFAAVFGRLYEWLAYDSEDHAYEPLRDIIRRHVIETMPVGPEDRIFGEPLTQRKLHSLHSASRQYGLHPKRLRTLLIAAGHIRDEDRDLTGDRILFDADGSHDLLERLSKAVSLEEAQIYLNAPAPHTRLLLSAGFIKPVARADGGQITKFVFDKEELDMFLSKLSLDSSEATANDDSMDSITKAAKRAFCSSTDIVQMIFDRKLSRVARRQGTTGFMSILVDADEVKQIVRGPELNGLRMVDVEKGLGLRTQVVKALIERDFLPSATMPNPVNRTVQRFVKEQDLVAFKLRFVTIDKLAKERKTRRAYLRPELDALGILPAFVLTELGLPFYERTAIHDRLKAR
jgi:TniQ